MTESQISQKSLSRQQKMSKLSKLAFGLGHVLNDLCGNCWFSYILIYMTKVVGLSNGQAGLILLIGQFADGLFTPFVGYGCDRTKLKIYGKRKFWHLIGSTCVTVSFPFIFNLIVTGHDGVSSSFKMAYYAAFVIIFQFGWGAGQISHLSLIPTIIKKPSENVELNAIRSGFTFACGIAVFAVTWLLLGTSSGERLTQDDAKEFQQLVFIITGAGLFFTILFHLGIYEPRDDVPKEIEETEQNCLKRLCASSTTSTPEDSPSLMRQYDEKVKNIEKKQLIVSYNQETQETTKTEVEKGATQVGPKLWKDWLRSPALYKVSVVYMLTRLVMNVFQSFFVQYLTEALSFNKEAIAYFPLIVLIVGVLASVPVKKLTKVVGNKITFVIGAALVVVGSIWLLTVTEEHRQTVYGAVCFVGSGTSIMLVTALTMTGDLIGDDKTSSAFVYAAMSFTDKLSTGVVIAAVQAIKPASENCLDCPLFLKLVQSCIPGGCALIAAVIVVFCFPSEYTCRRVVSTKDEIEQTNESVLREIFVGDEKKQSDICKMTSMLDLENLDQQTKRLSAHSLLSSHVAYRLASPNMFPSTDMEKQERIE